MTFKLKNFFLMFQEDFIAEALAVSVPLYQHRDRCM